MTKAQAKTLYKKSLATLRARAGVMTYQEFCNDCPKRVGNCFPCKSAGLMIEVYLAALVTEQAKLN